MFAGTTRFAFYNDVVNNPAEADNMVPADPYMLQDIENNNLANFTWILPRMLSRQWQQPISSFGGSRRLSENLPAGTSPPIQAANCVYSLIVTFDESELSGDNQCGGGSRSYNCGGHIWHVVTYPG